MTPYEILEKNNRKLTIWHDEHAENPIEDECNIFEVALFSRHINQNKISILEANTIAADSKNWISFPVYMYDHSAISLSLSPFSCPWDSGQLGIIYNCKKNIREQMQWKIITKERKEKLREYAENQIQTYEDYLNGNVFGFYLYEDNEQVDQCWGFYGADHNKSGLYDSANFQFLS
jgi:hypothetical protein